MDVPSFATLAQELDFVFEFFMVSILPWISFCKSARHRHKLELSLAETDVFLKCLNLEAIPCLQKVLIVND